MEARNLRKERTGIVLGNKMDKTITVAAKFKRNIPYMVSLLVRQKNTMHMMKRMNAMLVIQFALWRLVP